MDNEGRDPFRTRPLEVKVVHNHVSRKGFQVLRLRFKVAMERVEQD